MTTKILANRIANKLTVSLGERDDALRSAQAMLRDAINWVYNARMGEPETRIFAETLETTEILQPIEVDSPAALDAWIARLPRAQLESTTAINASGREHTAFSPVRFFKIGDEEQRTAAWRSCASSLAWDIYSHLMGNAGDIVWRVRPEFDVQEIPIFVRYGQHGPDRDVCNDGSGWADKRFGAVKGYARLSTTGPILFDE